MTRRRRIPILAAAALVAAAAPAAWYVASPWWTLRQMRDAARAGDVARFASYVDTAAIDAAARRDYRRWWGSVLATPMRDSENARRFRALAQRRLAVPDREIGIPPQEMMPWFAEMPVPVPLLGAGPDKNGDRPYIVRDGLARFEVRYGDNDPDRSPLLTFRREGLGWRLDGIRWGQH